MKSVKRDERQTDDGSENKQINNKQQKRLQFERLRIRIYSRITTGNESGALIELRLKILKLNY